MSISLARYENLEAPPQRQKTWLWIVLYEDSGTSHWAYVIGTKPDVLQRKGVRFNIWKCHRLELDPESKFEHQDKIFEPEDARSSHGGCYNHTPFSFFQLAEINDENAFRRHLLTYAIPDAPDTGNRTCRDWAEAIFEELETDRAITLCQSTRSNRKINAFEDVEASCTTPGVHCPEEAPDHSSSWRVTEQGIQTRERASSTQVEAEHASGEAPRSPRAKLVEGLRKQLSRE